MRNKLIGCILILLVLVGVTASATLHISQSSLIEAKGKQCVREGRDSVSGSHYALEQIGWSERMWASRRNRRPYRKRFRRYRLDKKQRRQLRRRLRRIAEIAEEFSGSGEKMSSVSLMVTEFPIGASCPSARCG